MRAGVEVGMKMNPIRRFLLKLARGVGREKIEIRKYGNYALFDVNATHEDMEKALLEVPLEPIENTLRWAIKNA